MCPGHETNHERPYEEDIESRAESLPETRKLMTAPGISHLTVLTIHAEIGDVGRFGNHKEVVSYVGMNPTIRESGDSRFEGGISKRGSGRVRWLLVQATYNAVHNCQDEYLSQFYKRSKRSKQLFRQTWFVRVAEFP
jgi:transposase